MVKKDLFFGQEILCDLNPIQNAWSKLKLEVIKKKPKTAKNLKMLIKKEWKLQQKNGYHKLLIDSFKKRMKEFKKKKTLKLLIINFFFLYICIFCNLNYCFKLKF